MRFQVKWHIFLGLFFFLQLSQTKSRTPEELTLFMQKNVELLIEKVLSQLHEFYREIRLNTKCIPDYIPDNIMEILKKSIDCVSENERNYANGIIKRKTHAKNFLKCFLNAKKEVNETITAIDPYEDYCPENMTEKIYEINVTTSFVKTFQIDIKNGLEVTHKKIDFSKENCLNQLSNNNSSKGERENDINSGENKNSTNSDEENMQDDDSTENYGNINKTKNKDDKDSDSDNDYENEPIGDKNKNESKDDNKNNKNDSVLASKNKTDTNNKNDSVLASKNKTDTNNKNNKKDDKNEEIEISSEEDSTEEYSLNYDNSNYSQENSFDDYEDKNTSLGSSSNVQPNDNSKPTGSDSKNLKNDAKSKKEKNNAVPPIEGIFRHNPEKNDNTKKKVLPNVQKNDKASQIYQE